MVRVRQGSTALGSAALVALLSVGVTACGDNGDEVAAVSTADFCVEAQQLDQGDDAGPFAAFYDKHPDPKPADWAADGYLVTESIQAVIDDLEAVHPSQEAQPFIEEALAAMEVMKQNSVDVSEAGKNDDQAALDELEQVNQDTNVPALMASIQAVADLCETSAGS